MWLNRRSVWEDTQLLRASHQVESDKHHDYFPLSLTWVEASEALSKRETEFPFPWGMECLPLDAAETGNSRLSFSWWIVCLRAAVWGNHKIPVLLTRCWNWCPMWSFRDNVFTKSQNHITPIQINNAVHWQQLPVSVVLASYFSPTYFFSVSLKLNYFILQMWHSWWH